MVLGQRSAENLALNELDYDSIQEAEPPELMIGKHLVSSKALKKVSFLST